MPKAKTKETKEVRETKQTLKCIFTDAELLEKGRSLAETNSQLEVINNDKTRVVADFGAKIRTVEADITVLTNAIRSGYEFREVKCTETLADPVEGKKTIRRTDTGETVAIKEMTAEEMQRQLDFEAAQQLEA